METTSKLKTICIWIGVNKNGFVGLHLEEPTKNIQLGKWQSNKPFCNSIIQNQIENLVKQAQLNWESEPEYIEITYDE